MTTTQLPADFPQVQGAVYRLALSLDAFIVNGIQQGVLQQDLFPGFLEKVVRNFRRDLAGLEEQALHVPSSSQPRVKAILALLSSKCQQLADLATALSSWATLPLHQLRLTVSRIPLLRSECVQLIQELEACLRVTKPFYPSRPSHSTASVDNVLANLERAFTDAWAATNTGRQVNGVGSSPGLAPALCPHCGAVLQVWLPEMQQQTCSLCRALVAR